MDCARHVRLYFPLFRTSLQRLVQTSTLVLLLAAVKVRGTNDLILNVRPESTSVQIGENIIVDMEVANLTVAINGVQAFIQYDVNLLTLLEVIPNVDEGAGWTGLTITSEGGQFIQFAVMLGGSSINDHVVTTFVFRAKSPGNTQINMIREDPPFLVKLTDAIDSSPISPTLWDSQDIAISLGSVPTLSQWSLFSMAIVLLISGTLIIKKGCIFVEAM